MTPDDFPKTPKDFFAFAKKHQSEMVDRKFVDMLGSWQHCSFPVDTLDEGTFEEGLGFDGSSIRGWMGIHESDMMALPDPSTARLDPFFARPTVSVIADVVDPVTRKEFTRDPRHGARKAEEFLRQSQIADTCFISVLAYDLADRIALECQTDPIQTVLFDLTRHEVSVGNFQFLFLDIAGKLDHFHAIQKRRRDA